jgi:GxxExxY protein
MLLYEDLSNKIIRAYYNILDNLGEGFLEKVYENAMCIELEEMGIPFEQQKAMSVTYKGHIIGDYVADIVVDNKIILELKSIPLLTAKNTAQLINYLAITGHKVGYLLNFGDKSEYKRVLRKGALNE